MTDPLNCSLCRQIPRHIEESSPYRLPELLNQLLPQGPWNESGRRHCPECATDYVVEHSEEYDDMDYYETIIVTRDVSAKALPELLEHAEGYVRRDAAFGLARRGQAELALGHADASVRKEALLALQAPTDLRAYLRDEDAACRQLAARLTLSFLLQNQDSQALVGLLESATPDVRAQAVATLVHGQGLEVGLLAPYLEDWRVPEELTGLAWLADQGYEIPRQIRRLREALADPRADARKAALRLLGGLRPHWGEETGAILAAVLHLLESDAECRYPALSMLRQVVGHVDLRDLYPYLVSLLLSDGAYFAREAGRVLQFSLKAGQLVPGLAEQLLPGWQLKNDQQRGLACGCYQFLCEADCDLGSALPTLMQGLCAEETGLTEDLLIPAFTGYLVRHGHWAELERLLRANPSVAGHVAMILGRLQVDLAVLKPVLTELLEHPSQFVSSYAAKALS